jgi:hypothetical protein
MAMAQGSKLLVTGGTDETIRIFDLGRGCAMGTLYEHKGSIVCLKFVGDKFLLSGGQDGVMVIWRVKDWEPMHIFKAHKASIVDISVHPSNRMALSIGRDSQLRLWDLMNGSCAVTKKIEGHSMEACQWAPTTGMRFALLGRDEITVADLISDDTSLRDWYKVPDACCMLFASDSCLIVGTSKGEVIVFDVRPEVGYKELHRHKAHEGRVKSISSAGSGALATIGGDGGICFWAIDNNSLKEESVDDFEGPLEKKDMELVLNIEGPREQSNSSTGKDGKEVKKVGAAMARITSVCTNGFNWVDPISFETTSKAGKAERSTSAASTQSASDEDHSEEISDDISGEEEEMSEDELLEEMDPSGQIDNEASDSEGSLYAEEIDAATLAALQKKHEAETRKVTSQKSLSKASKLEKKKKVAPKAVKKMKNSDSTSTKVEAPMKKKMKTGKHAVFDGKKGKLAKKKKKVA